MCVSGGEWELGLAVDRAWREDGEDGPLEGAGGIFLYFVHGFRVVFGDTREPHRCALVRACSTEGSEGE